MEFADEGGEGATPYEVLLGAAIRGESTKFTRQDSIEEAWRILQPLIDDPPEVHAYRPGSWKPKSGRRRHRGLRIARPMANLVNGSARERDTPTVTASMCRTAESAQGQSVVPTAAVPADGFAVTATVSAARSG